jgi:hypothetical protein
MSFGMIALGPKTVTAFADRWGGIVPAFFVLIPFGLVSLLFLYPMLKSLNRQEIEPSPAAG